jgi:23S rRNA (guanosine2251-2'-O)-methyltransferase
MADRTLVEDERLPFQATSGAVAYESIEPLPVTVLLDNVRSAYNVGSFFRTADAARVERLVLCGITSCPPHKGVLKTALGAENAVAWDFVEDSTEAALTLRERGHELATLETSVHSVDLFDWVPQFPVCLVFGNELAGIRPELVACCDVHVRIPMLGLKHSLNVATAGGITIFELLRKYREMVRTAGQT